MTSVSANRADYEERLNRVTAYIYEHLDEEIDVARLADVACLSAYHWHRVYHAMRGETIAATVKRLRLQRAAADLANTTMSTKAIAQRCGYPNVQSFTRIFSSAYGLSPARYRLQGSHTRFRKNSPKGHLLMYEVAIKSLPAMRAVTVEHVGSPLEVGRAFDRLFGWLGTRNLIVPGLRSVSIYGDDPSVVPEHQLRILAGVVAEGKLPIDEPLRHTAIAGGSYAVLRHKGPYANMRAAYEWLYGTWLPGSGREAADAPAFEEYLNSPRETAPTELMTEINLPLK
jgi:AraC family transcriptional regulator